MTPPGVRFVPGFLEDPEPLFAHLAASVAWDERMKARKTASFGVAYDYSQMSYAPTPMPPELEEIGRWIEGEIGFLPDNCLLNYYEDGESSMGFHSDAVDRLAPGTGVAIVSLGSERPIVFRSKADKDRRFKILLASGSLLYMPRETQEGWQHAIPRVAGAGGRISLTFRALLR